MVGTLTNGRGHAPARARGVGELTPEAEAARGLPQRSEGADEQAKKIRLEPTPNWL